jgi:hypothetical protein
MKPIDYTPNVVLVLGSAPDALEVREWDRSPIASIVAINNAWAIRDDWDYLIYPDDFPSERLPATQSTSALRITSEIFVPAQNEFGGFVYAGGTMAFTSAYWALHALKPDVLAFLGCDMIYSGLDARISTAMGRLIHFGKTSRCVLLKRNQAAFS